MIPALRCLLLFHRSVLVHPDKLKTFKNTFIISVRTTTCVCVCITVPGSPPYGLAYDSISSSEVNVSWSPPLIPNGVILYYSVEYWNTTHTLNITTHTPSVLLSNLRKYAHYRLSIQAATRVGLGNHSSEILNITTLEDGECLYVYVCVRVTCVCVWSDNNLQFFFRAKLDSDLQTHGQ